MFLSGSCSTGYNLVRLGHTLVIDYSTEGIKLAEEIGLPDCIGYFKNHLGFAYKEKGNYDLAIKNYEEPLRLLHECFQLYYCAS